MNRATPRQSMYIKLKDDLGIYIYYVHDMNLTPELSARIREHNFLKPCGVTPSFTIAHMADFIVNNSVEPLTKKSTWSNNRSHA